MGRSSLIAMLLACGLSSVVPAPAHAQLGALKKRIKEQITGPAQNAAKPQAEQQDAAAAAGGNEITAASYTAPNKLPITAANVDKLIAGLRAEQAERERLAADASTNAGVRKFWKRQERRLYCDSLQAWRKSELERLQKQIQQSMGAVSSDVQQKFLQLNRDLENGCDLGPEPDPNQGFFAALSSARSQQDDVGARAAGLTRAQYGYLRERVAAAVILQRMPGSPFKYEGYTDAELAAVRARYSVLVPLVLLDFTRSGDRGQTGP